MRPDAGVRAASLLYLLGKSGILNKKQQENAMHTFSTLPAAEGFRMPAEYEPHRGCVMIWPVRPGSWLYGGRGGPRRPALSVCVFSPRITRSRPQLFAAALSFWFNCTKRTHYNTGKF